MVPEVRHGVALHEDHDEEDETGDDDNSSDEADGYPVGSVDCHAQDEDADGYLAENGSKSVADVAVEPVLPSYLGQRLGLGNDAVRLQCLPPLRSSAGDWLTRSSVSLYRTDCLRSCSPRTWHRRAISDVSVLFH